jgi:hypothetical protein
MATKTIHDEVTRTDEATRPTELMPGKWTRPLQVATAAVAALDVVGSILVGFVFENVEVIRGAMERSGMSPAEAASAAPVFTFWYRTVALLFIISYIIAGYYALKGKTWAFWLSLLTFGITGWGVIGLSTEDIGLYGLGYAIFIINDGAALLLTVVLVLSFLYYRTAWAQIRRGS